MNFTHFYNGYPYLYQENPFFNPQVIQKIQQLTELLNQKDQEIRLLKQSNTNLQDKVQKLHTEIDTLQKKNRIIKKSTKNYYRKNAVGGPNGQTRLYCPYSQCHHHYSSVLALNFHIKSKHQGGNKKQRQAYAKIIIQAQQNGQEPPKINFNFPPGFLQKYREQYLKAKQRTEMNQKPNQFENGTSIQSV